MCPSSMEFLCRETIHATCLIFNEENVIVNFKICNLCGSPIVFSEDRHADR